MPRRPPSDKMGRGPGNGPPMPHMSLADNPLPYQWKVSGSSMHNRNKICSWPGCPNLNCQIHQTVRRADNRPSAARRGYDATWRRIRSAFLKQNPNCMICGEKATEVDHIVPLRNGGTNAWSNLRGMCKSCHSRHTAKFGGGFGNGIGRRNR